MVIELISGASVSNDVHVVYYRGLKFVVPILYLNRTILSTSNNKNMLTVLIMLQKL